MTAKSTPGFIHLRVHSAYSLLEGALPVKVLAKLAAKDAQPALAVTDRNNLFGALEIAETLAGAGVQPITGCTLALRTNEAEADQGARKTGNASASPVAGSIALLVKDAGGYRNLMALTSGAFLEHPDDAPTHVTWDELARHSAGLIALTGGPDGPIDRLLREDNIAAATAQLEALKGIFGNRLYVEIQRHGTAEEARIEPELVKLAYGLQLPLVATNQCYFPARDDFEAHDALICIAEGRYIAEDDRRKLTPEHYFKSRAEMMALFADLPEALAAPSRSPGAAPSGRRCAAPSCRNSPAPARTARTRSTRPRPPSCAGRRARG